MENPIEGKARILIVDDEEQIRNLIYQVLQPDHDCTIAGSAEEALEILRIRRFELVLSDINLGGMSGLELVPRVLEKHPDTVVIMISGQQTIEYAIEAMRVGAFDYITKPLDLRHVDAAVRRALSHHELLKAKRRYENHLEDLVKERTAEVERLAYYDRLTNLPNRILFSNECAQAVSRAKQNGHRVGVLLLSIDHFKGINDTLGHDAGDQLLIEVATRLQSYTDKEDMIARFEGAEFALLLAEMTDAQPVEELSLSIFECLKAPFCLAAQQVYVSPSIGISLFPFNGEDGRALLQNAGTALQRANKLGGNNCQFHAAEMNASALNRLTLETSLRRAIDNSEFLNHYQPVIDLVSNHIVGVEALIRWQHPELGLLPPAEFLPLAEDTGLIVDISGSVMRAACFQARQWQLDGCPGLRVAVNVSARQFRNKDFIDGILQVLIDSSLDPTYLELELTETSIMENPKMAARILSDLRRLGVRIAIDDFGTGYSSLSYLKRFPVDTLKLDRSFVTGATTDPDDAALVMAIVTLAHNLRLSVVAEGIETQEELNFLRLLRCDEGQGYFFSKPQPAEVLTQFLSKTSGLHYPLPANPNAHSRFALTG